MVRLAKICVPKIDSIITVKELTGIKIALTKGDKLPVTAKLKPKTL
jgi:hypothetical protein